MRIVLICLCSFVFSVVRGQGSADNCEEITQSQIFFMETSADSDTIFQQCRVGSFVAATADMISDICLSSNYPTVWYRIVADADAEQIFTSVIPHDCWTAQWALYSASEECGDLMLVSNSTSANIISCGVSAEVLQNNIEEYEDSSIYYLLVQAIDPINNMNFDICVHTINQEESQCIIDPIGCGTTDDYQVAVVAREEVGDLSGPYYPGERLEVCVDYFFEGSSEGVEWLIGIVPIFGDGWSLDNFDISDVVVSPGGNQWFVSGDSLGPQIQRDISTYCTFINNRGDLELCDYSCEPCLECENSGMKIGDALPSGWYWVTAGGLGGCDNDGSPGEGYGIGQVSVYISLCLELEVASIADEDYCTCDKDLTIGVFPLADDIAGCWVDPVVCSLHSKQERSVGEIFQQPHVSIDSSQLDICSGSSTYIQFTSNSNNAQILSYTLANDNILGATEDTLVYDFNGGFIEETLINTSDTVQELSYVIKTQDRNKRCAARLDTLICRIQPQIVIQNNNVSFCESTSYTINPEILVIESADDVITWTYDESTLIASVVGDDLVISEGNTPGIYQASLTVNRLLSGQLCSATQVINIEVLSVNIENITDTLCPDDSIIINDVIFDINNPIGTIFIAGQGDCGTLIQIYLSFYNDLSANLLYELCPGESIEVFGITIVEEVENLELIDAGGSSTGCDSIVTLSVVFYPPSMGMSDTIICEGDIVIFNGQTIDQAGSYQLNLTNASQNTCDSLDVLNVSIHDALDILVNITDDDGTNSGSIDISATSGIASIIWSTGATETLLLDDLAFGTYTATITDSNGCISTYDYKVPLSSASQDVLLSKIEIFPNPSTDIFNIIATDIQLVDMKILDLQGSLVYQCKGHMIDLRNATQGVYVLLITTANGAQLTQKIVKM